MRKVYAVISSTWKGGYEFGETIRIVFDSEEKAVEYIDSFSDFSYDPEYGRYFCELDSLYYECLYVREFEVH